MDIDLSSGDLAFDELGQLVTVTDDELVAQRVKIRLSMRRGEEELDTSLGLDWLGEILVKRPNLALIRARVAVVIKGAPGVAEVTRVDVSYDPTLRTATISFEARSDSGAVISGAVSGGA